MQSLVVGISNPDTVHAIAEAAKRQGTTPEAAATKPTLGPSTLRRKDDDHDYSC